MKYKINRLIERIKATKRYMKTGHTLRASWRFSDWTTP